MTAALVQTPTGKLYDLPIIGDDFAKIGRIIDLYVQPCSPEPILWVYGFFQAIPTLFVTLTKPELVDISVKKGGHRPRTGRKSRFRANAVFRDALIEIPVPRWVAFRLYEWGQRIGWYFLVADALEDFAINWMSMAYKYEGCQGDLPPYATWTAESRQQSTTDGLWPMLWVAQTVNKMTFFPPDAYTTIPGQYDVAWNCHFEPTNIPEDSVIPHQTVLIVTPQSGSEVIAVGETGDRGDGTVQNSGRARIFLTGPANFRLYTEATRDGHCLMTGDYAITYTDFAALAPDP